MSDNPKKLPPPIYLNKTRDTLLSIVTNSKLTSSSKKYPILKGLIFLTSEGVFEKLLDCYYDPKLVRTDEDIHDAVKLWCTERTNALQKYGNIEDWDVSNVTNMIGLFNGCYYFNDDISKWDVSKVTNMSIMF